MIPGGANALAAGATMGNVLGDSASRLGSELGPYFFWQGVGDTETLPHSVPDPQLEHSSIMEFLSSLPPAELGRYSSLIQEVVAVRRHADLFHWLQGEVQHYLPHDVMIAAWGDFHLGRVKFDIVSALPGIRTATTAPAPLMELLRTSFDLWVAGGKVPRTSPLASRQTELRHALGGAVEGMRSSVVHGIRDERGRHDCLYVTFSSRPSAGKSVRDSMAMLLPYVDTALRQMEPFPTAANVTEAPVTTAGIEFCEGLTSREVEIMDWVRKGKTNQEIGSILDISAFTVKNHMQRIFRKIHVGCRAAAVGRFGAPVAHA